MISIPTNGQTSKPKFPLGQILATPGAIEALQQSNQLPVEFLARHIAGDWGEVCPDDKALNDDQMLEIIQQELSKRCQKSKTRGRPGTTSGVVCCSSIPAVGATPILRAKSAPI